MASVGGEELPQPPRLSVSEKIKEKITKENTNWRSLVAYWILGICNNYGYVVMLSAANDILHQHEKSSPDYELSRQCNFVSTGAILLADVVPSLIIKICSPFLPFYINVRMVLVVLFGAAGYISVAFSTNQWISITGVVFTSFCSGLGEATLLQYSSNYDKNVLSTWSSGTGVAGIAGAFSYASLTALGIKTTLLIMLIVPTILAITFWTILPKPTKKITQSDQVTTSKPTARSFKQRLALMPGLLKYMVPLGLVYLFEYLINQGMFELIQFEDIFIDFKSQYRWLQVDYQLGVFISRSSVNLIHFKHIWVMGLLQLMNLILFTTEAIFWYTPYFWIVLIFVLWEGLLGGAAYVNTYYTISMDVPEEDRALSLGMTSFADSIGITLAGGIAIVAHDAILFVKFIRGLMASSSSTATVKEFKAVKDTWKYKQ